METASCDGRRVGAARRGAPDRRLGLEPQLYLEDRHLGGASADRQVEFEQRRVVVDIDSDMSEEGGIGCGDRGARGENPAKFSRAWCQCQRDCRPKHRQEIREWGLAKVYVEICPLRHGRPVGASASGTR